MDRSSLLIHLNELHYFKLCVFYTAPSGTPASVAVKAVSSTKVEVSWKVKFSLSFITFYLHFFFHQMIIFAN